MLYCFSDGIYIVYKWQTKDKKPQSSNVNAMNLLQNSRWTQTFTKIDQMKHKIKQICIWNPIHDSQINDWCKHWFTLSVWHFCRWSADVSPGKMSQGTRSMKKWLLLMPISIIDLVVSLWSNAYYLMHCHPH